MMGREERAKAINFISCSCLFFSLSLSSDSVFPPADFFFSVAVCVKGKESVGLLRDLHFLSLSRGTPLRCFPSSVFHLPPRCPRPPSGEASCLIRLPARLAVKMSGVFAGRHRRINGTGKQPTGTADLCSTCAWRECDEDSILHRERKDTLVNRWYWTSRLVMWKRKIKLNPYLTTCTLIKSRWIKPQNDWNEAKVNMCSWRQGSPGTHEQRQKVRESNKSDCRARIFSNVKKLGYKHMIYNIEPEY